MPGRYDPRNFAVVSSGDREADQRAVRDDIKARALLDEGMCPNGCGPRAAGTPHARRASGSHCPTCGFVSDRPVLDRQAR